MKKKEKVLKLGDRIAIVQLIPAEGKFEDLIAREDIIEKCRITQDEIDKYEIKSVSNGQFLSTTWSSDADKKDFKYDFTSLESELIKKTLKKASDEERLGANQVNLYKLFVD